VTETGKLSLPAPLLHRYRLLAIGEIDCRKTSVEVRTDDFATGASTYGFGCLSLSLSFQVLVETLIALGAKVRWATCNIYSTEVGLASFLVSVHVISSVKYVQVACSSSICVHDYSMFEDTSHSLFNFTSYG